MIEKQVVNSLRGCDSALYLGGRLAWAYRLGMVLVAMQEHSHRIYLKE